MRLGLLGLGRIGAFHAETLASLPAVEELVLSDPVPALAEQANYGDRRLVTAAQINQFGLPSSSTLQRRAGLLAITAS